MSDRVNRRASRVALVLGLLIATYYAVWGGEYDLSDIRELRAAEMTAIARVDSLTSVLDSVSAWADSLESDPAVIERVARERHSFIRPGELLFIFVEPAQEE